MTQKKNPQKKSRRVVKKPKSYIAPYKIIIVCSAVIVLCVFLLLAANIASVSKNDEIQNDEIQSEKTEKIENNKNLTENPVKIEIPVQKENSKEKIESKNSQSENSKKQSEKKSENQKITENQKKQDSNSNQKKSEENSTKENSGKTVVQQKKSENQEEKKVDYNFPVAKNGAKLVFVFDDGGHNLNQLKRFLELPFDFTVAVLPKLEFSFEAANLVRQSGNEVILHQPMQAVNKDVNPGEGAIKPDMSEDEIISVLRENLREISPVAGLNNHEGSLITSDSQKMSVVLKVASEQGIFFLDSRTNVETKVPEVARALGYGWYERNVFLDNSKVYADIMKEIRKGIEIANKNGCAIMIGHVWSYDVLPEILESIYPELKQKGYLFTTVSESGAIKR